MSRTSSSKDIKNRNFLVTIGNIYDSDKRFFDFDKKSKYIPCFISAGALHEKAIRHTCISFHSFGMADCIVHFPTNAPLSRFSVRLFGNEMRCDFDDLA